VLVAHPSWPDRLIFPSLAFRYSRALSFKSFARSRRLAYVASSRRKRADKENRTARLDDNLAANLHHGVRRQAEVVGDVD
jgi:hypothetical protein